MSATHGLAGTYRRKEYACRCPDCTGANTRRARSEKTARARRLAADPTLAEHGRASTYTNWGCRCPDCTKANSEKCAARKNRRAKRAPEVKA